MELKTHNTYIFDNKKSIHPAPFKGQINEITEKTIRVTNLDTNITFREKKINFDKEWEAIEVVGDSVEEFREVMGDKK